MEDIPNKVRDILGIIVDVNLKTEDSKLTVNVHCIPLPEYNYEYAGLMITFKTATLKTVGAVSEPIVREMVWGLKKQTGADICIALSPALPAQAELPQKSPLDL